MKRRSLVALIMASVVTLSVAGCGGKEDVPTSVETVEFDNIAGNVANGNQEDTAEEASTEEQTDEEENHEGKYRSELTNEWIDESLKNQRPIAVMVDNERVMVLENHRDAKNGRAGEVRISVAKTKDTKHMEPMKRVANY